MKGKSMQKKKRSFLFEEVHVSTERNKDLADITEIVKNPKESICAGTWKCSFQEQG